MSSFFSPLSISREIGLSHENHVDIGLVGDLLFTAELLDGADIYLPNEPKDILWKYFSECSLIIANLEAPITECDVPAESKPFNLKNSPRSLELFDSRFVLSLANNHIMDFGSHGLFDTLEALDVANLAYVGAGRNLEQARAPRYKTIDGIRSAVIGAADPRFQSASQNNPGTSPAIRELLVDSILEARLHAQFIAVTIHMGLEYADIPSNNQILLGEACLTAGAHIVQFHHSHCLSGCAGNGRGVVLFGTGNYVFPQVTGFDVPKTKRTATWLARYLKDENIVTSLCMEPAIVDRCGLPRTISGIAADIELKEMNRLSQRMMAPYWRKLWRICDLLHPSFLMPTFRNFHSMLKKHGALYVTRSLFAGVKAQILR